MHRTATHQLLTLVCAMRANAEGPTVYPGGMLHDAIDTVDEKMMDDAADVEAIANAVSKGDLRDALEIFVAMPAVSMERVKTAAPAAYKLLFPGE